METLLVLAIIIMTVAVVIQAGVLVAMYLLSRRVASNVNGLVSESQKLMTPAEVIANNLKSASDNIAEIGKNAREDVHRVEETLKETGDTLRMTVEDVRRHINDTAADVHKVVMAPVREWSAIARGIAVGIRTFFTRRPNHSAAEPRPRKTPAA
jgi:hypothetical protein